MTLPADLPPREAAWAVAGAAAAAVHFANDVAALDEDAMHAPSALDGWSRGMVCAHIAHVGTAMARLTRDGLAGRTGTPMYPDGRAERDATVAHGRRLSAGELRARLAAAQDALDSVWPDLPPEAWATVRRDPELGQMLLTRLVMGRWTELEVHRTDLVLPGAALGWSPAFVEVALPLRLAWLGPHQRRHAGPDAPDGTWAVVATGPDRTWEVTAAGSAVHVKEVDASTAPVAARGTPAEVLATLLGRRPPADSSFRAAFPGP